MNKKAKGSATVVLDIQEQIKNLITETQEGSLSSKARRDLESQIKALIGQLGTFLNNLDPIRQPTSVFDPSNPKIIGRFISLALVAQTRHPLKEINRFYGAGIYAIYYNGPFKLYGPISKTENPIYVGQAAPDTPNARTPIEQGDKLCSRLEDHKKNIIKATGSLKIEDFEYRSLVVQSGWETAAEDYLIHLFKPIWNSETGLIFGLGKHGDNAKTRANKRSPWDTLHPGRTWAADTSLEDAKTPAKMQDELKDHFAAHPVFKSLESVLNGFIEELRQV